VRNNARLIKKAVPKPAKPQAAGMIERRQAVACGPN
jgi:hypothetical protein